MAEDKNINPEGPKKEEVKPINPVEDEKPHVGLKHLKIPHVGKREVKSLDLFNTGPFRGGSLGRKSRKK